MGWSSASSAVFTHASSWVTWEPETAIEMEQSIIAMTVKGVNTATLPALIRNKGESFYSWYPSKMKTYLAAAVVVM
jgi:hypothetical protein